MKMELINTGDGSHTIYLPEMDEQYHSVNGAITESMHVYIEKGFSFYESSNAVVFEIGFGTGLNCMLTALEAKKNNKIVTYYTIEKYPLEHQIVQQLNYGKIISKRAEHIFQTIHECEWDETVKVSENFYLRKIKADLTTVDLDSFENFNIIYFDAFGPDKQPEMWITDIFQKIYDQTSDNGIIVTYSAKGEVRRKLAACGFTMERLPGPPGKKQMLRGIKRVTNS